jgi:Skp family chaperone for outer membrane proteins
MDWMQTLVTIAGVLAGPAASIKVATLQAGRALNDLVNRLVKLEERVGALERTEPETVATLRSDLEALEKDGAALRSDAARLTSTLDKLVADDEKRRDKAAERAERRELREREQETALAAKMATVHTLLETLRQEIRDARSPR